MIVYFTSKTGNTKRFVDKLGYSNKLITPDLIMYHPFVLAVGTYARNDGSGAVPPQVIKFLNKNRHFIKGVIAGGNRNFGKHFAYSGDIISNKCNVDIIHKFELFGTDLDVEITKNKLKEIIYV